MSRCAQAFGPRDCSVRQNLKSFDNLERWTKLREIIRLDANMRLAPINVTLGIVTLWAVVAALFLGALLFRENSIAAANNVSEALRPTAVTTFIVLAISGVVLVRVLYLAMQINWYRRVERDQMQSVYLDL